MGRFGQALLAGLSPWMPQLALLQTIAGIDVMGAAMLLVEISADMHSFGTSQRSRKALKPPHRLCGRSATAKMSPRSRQYRASRAARDRIRGATAGSAGSL